MRRHRSLLPALLLVSLGLAGCADNSTPAQQTTSTTAPAPKADAETGAIHGFVVNEEALPIPGATVAIVQLALEAQTDAGGAFTFNELPAGQYTIVAAKLGYDSIARKADILIGSVTNVSLTLRSLTVASEPYLLLLPHTSFIQLGNAWGHFATFAINSTGAHSLMCQSCVWHFNFDAKPEAALTEAAWACSPCYPPLVNDDVWYLVTQNTSTTAATFINTYLSNKEQYPWTATQIKIIGHAVKNTAQWRINGGGGSVGSAGASGISYNQRVELWQTFAYHQELPENFTAFPPS